MSTTANTSSDNAAYRSIWSHLRTVSFRQGWIDAGGVNTRYVQAGPADAPAVIMLHGTGGSWEGFCANLGAHAEHFNCYAIDLVGSGFSGKPDVDYEIPVYVEHVRNFMRAVGLQRASLIGVSLGAWISARFALTHPDLTDKITLISASGLLTDGQTLSSIKSHRYKAVDDPSWQNVGAVFTQLIHDPANRIDDLVSVRQAVYRLPGMRRTMEHILCLQEPQIRQRNLIAEEEWRRIQAPTLLIGAVDHEDVFLETARRVSKWIPHARYVEIRHSAHWPQFEAPDAFNPVSIEFLRGR